jgi:tetratricopeptide (TPR) repeat protein
MRPARLTLLACLGLVRADTPPVTSAPASVPERARAIRTLLDAERWPEALADARVLRLAAPEDPEALAVLGETLFRAGRLAEAEELLAPLAGSPTAPGRALATLGRLREARGREAEAVELMRRAVAAAPGDREVLYRAAGTAADRAEAIERLARYLEQSAGDRPERIEAAAGTLRLFRALGTRPSWVPTARPPRVELPLTPLWIEQTGQVIGYAVKARIGARERGVPLLVDSGSPGLFVIERAARRAGFEPLGDITLFDGGGAGRHATRRGLFAALDLGGLRFTDALASVAPQELDPYGRFHGLLGLAALEGYRVTLDLSRDRLVLERGMPPTEGGTPYWVVDGQLLVDAETTAGPGLFLLDTGATRTLVASGLAAAAGARLTREADITAFGGRREGARALAGFAVRFQGFSVGPDELRAADLGLRSAVSGVEVSGFLGLDLLDGKLLEIDTVRRTVAIRAP